MLVSNILWMVVDTSIRSMQLISNLLLIEAYDTIEQSYDVWLADRRKFTCLEIECLMLLFVQSIRSGKFEMFVGVLDQFATWLFALDHTNYAWWLPVFIRSLKTLPHQYPNVYEQLLKGQFTTQKGKRKFLRILITMHMSRIIRSSKEQGELLGYLTVP